MPTRRAAVMHVFTDFAAQLTSASMWRTGQLRAALTSDAFVTDLPTCLPDGKLPHPRRVVTYLFTGRQIDNSFPGPDGHYPIRSVAVPMHVRAEFFMPALVPGKHLVVLEGRDAETLTLTLT